MITKVLIANRGENVHAVDVSLHRRACAAGDGDLAHAVAARQEAFQ